MPDAQASQISSEKRKTPKRLCPHINAFASINLVFKERDSPLEENEFKFLLATAIQSLHGDIANQLDVLDFKSIDLEKYTSIIRFKSIHYTRVVTSLLLFGAWNGDDCKFDILSTAQSPCFLSIQ